MTDNREAIEQALAVEQVMSKLAAELRDTLQGIALQGARRYTLPLPYPTTPIKVSSSAGRLAGLSLTETSGTDPATVDLLDDDELIARINLAPNESTREWWIPGGISFVHGLKVHVVSGAVIGAIFLGAVD